MESDDKWPIDKLPEEVLVEIFCFLDSKDLHELAKVRSDWKQLINDNARTRKKLTLQLDYLSRGSQGLQFDDFRYHKIEISGCNKSDWNGALGAMKKFSNDLRHLTLKNCYLSFNENMVEVFRSMGKLEVLDLHNVQTDSTFKDIQANKFDNLKEIIIQNSSWNVLKFIGLSQSKSLKINCWSRHLATSENSKELVEFLCTQTKLEELKCSGIDFSNVEIEPKDIEKMNFPLKRLTLHKLTNFMGGEENALAFLKRFANTLEELSLCDHFASSFYSLVIKKMQKLQSLLFKAYDLPEDENFYETLPNLSSVKKLVTWFDLKLIILFGLDGNQQGVQGVIGHLPNVETLVMSGWIPDNELMTFVSNNLLKLKSLNIVGFAGNAFGGVRAFENLRKIDIRSLREAEDEDWSEMLEAMPNVEQITVQSCSELNSAKFDAMTRSWPHLRILNLGYGFVPEAQMFNDLLARCPNITTVRVSSCKADDPAFKDFKKPGLRLIARENMDFERLVDEKESDSLNY